jgi:hypothetical protein
MSDFTKPSRENRRQKRSWKRPIPKKNPPKLAGRRGVEGANKVALLCVASCHETTP